MHDALQGQRSTWNRSISCSIGERTGARPWAIWTAIHRAELLGNEARAAAAEAERIGFGRAAARARALSAQAAAGAGA